MAAVAATHVVYDFGAARVVKEGDDLVVQKREAGAWWNVTRFNEKSDDYAYTHSSDTARAIAARSKP